jgi:GNAT superfamily N-acetyltransferase
MKKATIDDLSIIADCHMLCFPETLSAKLGKNFVVKSFLPFVTQDNCFMLFIEENGQCAGYVNGIIVRNNVGSASTMLQSAFGEGVKAFITKPWLLFNKELHAKLNLVARNLMFKIFKKYPSLPNNNKEIQSKPVSVGLPGMCVHPGHRRKGYATKLMIAAEEYARELGYRELHCTVFETNPSASDCHKKIGWIVEKVEGNALKMKRYLD